VHPTTISHWIKRAKLVELPDGGVTSVEAFKQLQKENQQLKEENEILKAAAVLLGRH
ncbi:transposase, partial [Oenococcus oeni IOEB_C28]